MPKNPNTRQIEGSKPIFRSESDQFDPVFQWIGLNRIDIQISSPWNSHTLGSFSNRCSWYILRSGCNFNFDFNVFNSAHISFAVNFNLKFVFCYGVSAISLCKEVENSWPMFLHPFRRLQNIQLAMWALQKLPSKSIIMSLSTITIYNLFYNLFINSLFIDNRNHVAASCWNHLFVADSWQNIRDCRGRSMDPCYLHFCLQNFKIWVDGIHPVSKTTWLKENY